MREILKTKPGETFTEKYRRLDDEHLTEAENEFLEAEHAEWAERDLLQYIDGRTTEARVQKSRIVDAQKRLDQALAALPPD